MYSWYFYKSKVCRYRATLLSMLKLLVGGMTLAPQYHDIRDAENMIFCFFLFCDGDLSQM